MTIYRRTLEVEAIQLHPHGNACNCADVSKMLGHTVECDPDGGPYQLVSIGFGLPGACPTDWLVIDDLGDIDVVGADYFAANYERVTW